MPVSGSISATILTKNSAKRIGDCLASLAGFPEVIVLDNGSTDKTIGIANTFSNVRVIHSEFSGFGALKNLAASHASNDWIFSIDSDEVVSAELAQNIFENELDPNDIGLVLRRNHYRGKLINGAGWQNDLSKRIYNKRFTSFTETLVHESLVGSGRLVRVHGDLLHFPFDSPEQLVAKADLYSSLYARENRFRKRSSRPKAALKAATTFVRDYLLKRGFVYGSDGLLLAKSHASGAFKKYSKLAEENRQLSMSLIITTYNREDALELVLLSVKSQSVLPAEVIIADDGSDEKTTSLIEHYQKDFPVPLIHCWQPDEGFRLAHIRNKAIAMSNCEYMTVIDGDMLLHRDFIKGHRDAAWKNQLIQGSRVWLSLEDANRLLRSKDQASIPTIFKLGNPLSAINNHFAARLFSHRTAQIDGVKGCNMSFWKDDCVRVNGFNEDFQSWGREDSEFVARMMNSDVRRLNLRFAGVAYHLTHKEADREEISTNDRILERTVREKLKYCENGLLKS